MKKNTQIPIIIILLLVLLGFMFLNKNKQKQTNNQNTSFIVCDEFGTRYESEQQALDAGLGYAQFGATYCPEYLASKGVTNHSSQYCYLRKTPTPPEFGNEYNYHFISFTLNKENNVSNGVSFSYPYGTDSQRGSFSGLLDPETQQLQTTGVAWGEGMRWESENIYILTDTGLQFVFNGNPNPDYELLRVNCEDYDKEWSAFETKQLNYSVNTTDRTRLTKLPVIKEQNLTKDELVEVQFVERIVDLDNNFETEEYLIYPYGPYYCGSGGCNLYIVNGNNDIISETSVTRLPVYTDLVDFEKNPPQKGAWKDIIVWSDGAYRKLTHDGTRYPSNPSLEPDLTVEEVELHPEMYFKLLDYIN